MYDVLIETWREGEYMEPMRIDLTTAEGFKEIEWRAAHDVVSLYGAAGSPGDAWETLAGRSLDEVAAQLANDLMQESVSLPAGAFADHAAAGRELRIIKQVATFVYRQMLRDVVTSRMRTIGVFPGALPRQNAAPPSSSHGQQRRPSQAEHQS